MSVPAVLVRKSTKEIIKHAPYPSISIEPIEDLDPDYEWLIEYIPYSEPDYDSRIYIMVTNLPNLDDLSTLPDHPLYPSMKAYMTTYSPERRTKEDIIISIENAEKHANNLVWSESIHKDKQLLMLNASTKAATGATLNSEEEQLLEEMNIIAVKLSKNKDNKEILVNQVNLNQVPNIDAGWENA